MEQERFEEFSALIAEVHGDIQKLKARYTAQLGLKGVHVGWLYLLNSHPEGLSASELAAAGRTDRSLVSRELDDLFQQGVVCAPEDTGRRRYGWKLKLTEKGERLARIISAVVSDIQRSVSGSIPTDDLAVFYRTLSTLAEGFRTLTETNQIQEIIDHEREIDQ